MLKPKSHFMNSALSIPRTFSCTLDSFLAPASCLFLPHLSTLILRNESTELLLTHAQSFINLGKTSSEYLAYEILHRPDSWQGFLYIYLLSIPRF